MQKKYLIFVMISEKKMLNDNFKDIDGTPFNEHDVKICNEILKDIVEKFRKKSES